MTKAHKKTDQNSQMNFSADVSRLLDIVANALYSNRDVFLRELISNAADACDRLRYDSIQNPQLIADNANFRIHIYKDTQTRTLTIVDNGIGMTKAELIDHLGTIAKSGTAKLMEQMKGKDDPLKLIGQFGVGFYASFMVANSVSVTSRKAGSKTASTWTSDGRTGFTVTPATTQDTAKLDGQRGTVITLHLKDEAAEFLLDEKIKQTVQQYSDHINVKIFLNPPQDTGEGEGNPINSASAIWKRQKSDITKEQHTEFYRALTGGFDEPLLTSHWHAEGNISYSALLYVPLMRPWNLYDPSREGSVKLYVRRVFISDNMPDLMYPWLRFIKGVIDSEDLPLNISRESLQHNPILHKIRTSVTTRILKDLSKLAQDDEPGFITFWGQFGAAIKEGLYDAHTHREDIFTICRFYSTYENGEKMTSLMQYIERMGENQKDIYYISGENVENVKNSPQIEGFKARGLEVLFMTDTIDEFWLQQVRDFSGKTFKSVTKGDIDFSDSKDENVNDTNNTENTETKTSTDELIRAMKNILSGEVSDVRISKRLTNSPVCLVASDNAPDMHMERVLKIQQNYQGNSKPILEINADHALIKKLAANIQNPTSNIQTEDAAYLLLDQALIIQGEPLPNPSEFARRMSAIMEKGLEL
jgi:molecular chaperone HtpG